MPRTGFRMFVRLQKGILSHARTCKNRDLDAPRSPIFRLGILAKKVDQPCQNIKTHPHLSQPTNLVAREHKNCKTLFVSHLKVDTTLFRTTPACRTLCPQISNLQPQAQPHSQAPHRLLKSQARPSSIYHASFANKFFHKATLSRSSSNLPSTHTARNSELSQTIATKGNAIKSKPPWLAGMTT